MVIGTANEFVPGTHIIYIAGRGDKGRGSYSFLALVTPILWELIPMQMDS